VRPGPSHLAKRPAQPGAELGNQINRHYQHCKD
jgi:hypothetical protein